MAAATHAAAHERVEGRPDDRQQLREPPSSSSGGALAAPAPPPWPARDDCLYASCYCEENIWHLAKALVEIPLDQAGWQLFVVFCSNSTQSVPLWRQRAAASASAATVWDYHVMVVARKEGQPVLVLDLDSTLPFPCSLAEYRRHALLGGDDSLPPHYRRLYRVVSAPLFLCHFASDRSHMMNSAGWLQPPPSWPCIAAGAGSATNTLPQYLDFQQQHHAATAAVEQQQHHAATAAVEQQQQQRQSVEHQQQQQQLEGEQQRHDRQQQEQRQDTLTAASMQPFGVVLPEPAFLAAFGLHS